MTLRPTACNLRPWLSKSDLELWQWPSIPRQLRSWRVHVPEVKVKCRSVQKLRVETGGQTSGRDCIISHASRRPVKIQWKSWFRCEWVSCLYFSLETFFKSRWRPSHTQRHTERERERAVGQSQGAVSDTVLTSATTRSRLMHGGDTSGV